MSADNWTICPNCAGKIEAVRRELGKQVSTAYGSVPQEEYLKLRRRFDEVSKVTPKHTLREDFEVGIKPGGNFHIWYEARCTECGWSFTFQHDQKASS